MKTETTKPRDRLYQAYWQDGSIDFFAGLGLTLIGIGWLIDQVVLSAVVPALLIPIWSAFRKKTIEPRLGYVQFDRKRRQSMKQGHLILVLMGVVSLLLGVGGFALYSGDARSFDLWPVLVPGIPAFLIAVAGIAAGLLFQMHRLALYGLFCGLCGIGVIAFHLEPGWALLGGGLVPLISGLVMLIRFFRTFPPLEGELV
jgi:hypothetical protein